MKLKNILIVGGVHGDEPTGIRVANYFIDHPIKESVIANPEAVKKNKRFIETDLNRSFNQDFPISKEEKIAYKLKKNIGIYETIIDIHNTFAESTTCAITTLYPRRKQIFLAKYFGFKNLVIMPPSSSLISLNPANSISLEISHSDMKLYSYKYLIEKIQSLDLSNIDADFKINIFKYVNSINTITLESVGLRRGSIKNFKKLNKIQKKILGINSKSDFYPIFAKKDLIDGFSLVKKIT